MSGASAVHLQGSAVVHKPDPVLLQVPPPGSLAQKVVQVPDLQLSHVLFLSVPSASGW
ncbi:hypothetical protein ACIRL0_12055 [Streptomyces sp. NPDC102365]|uniref:hypothetical protein n=1 Tax=Streptomyces sp. NPDC102365 TaxID=3366162 RepID=UPI0037F157A2